MATITRFELLRLKQPRTPRAPYQLTRREKTATAHSSVAGLTPPVPKGTVVTTSPVGLIVVLLFSLSTRFLANLPTDTKHRCRWLEASPLSTGSWSGLPKREHRRALLMLGGVFLHHARKPRPVHQASRLPRRTSDLRNASSAVAPHAE